MSYTVSNEGIGGGPFLTMTIDATENAGFDQDDVDAHASACRMTDNNEVGKGSAGEKLFGKVVWVSTDMVPGTTRPATCAVQARGVARLKISSPFPAVNDMVELAGDGSVRKVTAATDIAAGGTLERGQAISVDSISGWADIWLG